MLARFFAVLLLLLLALQVSAIKAGETTLVEIKTSLGPITVEIFTDEAPASANNFLSYVEQGFYDGTVFHRTIPGFMVQGGGFTESLQRKQTNSPVKNESNQTPPNNRGTLAMARTADPDSATSQFFINVADNSYLDHQPGRPGYAVFGKVVKGMDIVDQIANTPTQQSGQFANLPTTAVVIESARQTRLTKDK